MKTKGKWATQERPIVTALRRDVARVRAGEPAEERSVFVTRAVTKSVRALDDSKPFDSYGDRESEWARKDKDLWSRWCKGDVSPAETLAIWEHALARESAIKPTQSERLKWAEAEIDRLEALVKKLQAKKP